MVCILFMLIWPKTKVSSSKRLSSECPVCRPHSKTMATAWCQGKKPPCLSMPIAYLFLNREAVRSQVPWVLHIQAFISSLACRKAGRFIHCEETTEWDYLPFLSALQIICKSPGPLDVSSWGFGLREVAGMLPWDKRDPLSSAMRDFILRLSPSFEGWHPAGSGAPRFCTFVGGTAHWVLALETWQVYLVHRGTTFDSGLIKLAGLR